MALNPDHFAIVIGIDGYAQLRRLRSSGADATRFAHWLRKGGGLPDDNVKLVVSPPQLPAHPLDAEPVQRHIMKKLIEMGFRNKQRIGKRLYFYFAGHGIGPQFDDVGMLLADAAMDQLTSNLGLKPYRLFFRKWRLFDEVVFILDCCRDPIEGIGTAGPGFTFDAVQGAGGVTAAGAPPSVTDFVVLAAVYGRQAFAPEDTDTKERRGLLTKAVLEALEGTAPAAIDPLGRVTVSTLKGYVGPRIAELAKDTSLDQTPKFEDPDPPAEIVLATFEVPKIQVRIVVPAIADGDLVLSHAQGLREIERRSVATILAGGGTWHVSLDRGVRYLVALDPSGVAKVIDLRNPVDPHVVQFPKP